MAAERQLRGIVPRLSPANAAERQYVVLSRAINGDLSMVDFRNHTMSPRDQPLTMLWLRVPWERTRAMRLLNLQTLWDIQNIEGIESGTGTTSMDLATLNRVRVIQTQLAPLRSSELLNTLRTLIGVPPISRDWEEEGGWHQSITPVTLSQSYTAIETARRAAHVVLALQAWKLKHGSLPKSLDELVGPYLDDVSIDPYSYGPFRYFRDGLKIPLHWSQPLFGWSARFAEDDIPANEPFIWSAGPKISVQTPTTKDDIFSQYLVRSYWPYATPRFRSWSHKANSEYNIWEEGWPFPIP